ncbi:MAG: hypothetical protein NXI32_31075 [bacterium]|nr:hypothetical protein [bacterium]
MPEGFEAHYSPAGAAPEFTYLNCDGSFELNGSSGTATYVWPPAYYDDGSSRDNSNLQAFRDILEFVHWATINTPSGADEGWIFKVKNENFWFLFGTDGRTFSPGNHNLWTNSPIYRFYYSGNGTTFLRWRTIQGTRRITLTRTQDQPISTPPGDVTQPPGGPPTTRRIELGRHKKPNGWRGCPSNPIGGNFHVFGDTRDEWIKLWIDIEHPDIDSIINDVRDCAKVAAAATITAVVVTEGAAIAAAKTAFLASFTTCIQTKIGSAASQLDISFEYDTESGDWSGH